MIINISEEHNILSLINISDNRVNLGLALTMPVCFYRQHRLNAVYSNDELLQQRLWQQLLAQYLLPHFSHRSTHVKGHGGLKAAVSDTHAACHHFFCRKCHGYYPNKTTQLRLISCCKKRLNALEHLSAICCYLTWTVGKDGTFTWCGGCFSIYIFL